MYIFLEKEDVKLLPFLSLFVVWSMTFGVGIGIDIGVGIKDRIGVGIGLNIDVAFHFIR